MQWFSIVLVEWEKDQYSIHLQCLQCQMLNLSNPIYELMIGNVTTGSPIVRMVPKQLDLGSAYRLAPQSPVSRSLGMTVLGGIMVDIQTKE